MNLFLRVLIALNASHLLIDFLIHLRGMLFTVMDASLRAMFQTGSSADNPPPSPPETKTLPLELIMGFSACFSGWSAKTISASRTNPCNDCLGRGASTALKVCVCLLAHSATCTNYLPTVHLLTNLFSDSFNQTTLSTLVSCVVGSPILLKSEVRFFSSEACC